LNEKKIRIVRDFGEFLALSEEDKASFDTFVSYRLPETTQILDYILERNPNQLKWVHSCIAGVEIFLNSKAFKESPIPLTNARTAFSKILGEFVIMAMIYFTKNMQIFQEQ